MKLISTNPGKGYEINGEVEISPKEQIEDAVRQARMATLSWKETPLAERSTLVSKALELFSQKTDEIAELEMKEMGKTITLAQAEAANSLGKAKWFLENVEEAIRPTVTHEDDDYIHTVYYEPKGVVAAIAPWNMPFSMFIWGVIPNLLVGNTVVFKHSEECPLMGKLIEEVMDQVGFPEGVFSEIYGAGEAGEILTDQDIDLIWFTGSTAVGQKIFEKAGKRFIDTVLEMGGSNAAIVFEDIDVSTYVEKIHNKRFGNAGQYCDNLKRLVVHESMHDEMVTQLVALLKTKKFGDNSEPDTNIGPLVSEKQVLQLEEQVNDAVSKGVKVEIGGKRSKEFEGAYFEPTILTNVTEDMRAWSEELFGPVLIVVPFKTEEEALKIANGTEYGLGSYVFTNDKERAERVASRLEAGTVEVNSAIHWHHCNPFGGYKKSGKGREHGVMGFHELCQVKLISNEK